MLEQLESESDDFMAADADDPRLSVHGLSEFAFCARAGLCLHEQDFEEGEQETEADLYFLPMHEPRELRLVLEALMRQFMWTLFGGLGAFALFLGFAWYLGWFSLLLVAAATLLLTSWRLYDRGYWIYTAQQKLEMWHQAKPEMPDPDSPKIQDLDWRNLIASEATVVRPEVAYEHTAWKLAGRPWRILEYGDLRIPVFNHRSPWKDLFHQHIVRMAAYCHLLETTEGAQSPYGVIVKGETFAAVTVPNTPQTRAMFREALIAARRTIRDSEEINAHPPEPGHKGVCRNCHFGWPIRLQRKGRFARRGAPIEPKVVKDRAKTKYHSHCGDRFRGLPQHRVAVALELSED